MSKSIGDLLNSMQSTYKDRERKEGDSIKTLLNNRDTWDRIANGDSFDELGFDNDAEKEAFLAEWISENPYSDMT